MKKLYLIVLTCIMLILSIVLMIKHDTYIYIGDYTGNTRYGFDIKLNIDDKEILNDSLTSSFPYQSNFIIREKMKYGLHRVSIYSNRANVHMEEKIFLLPNQYISIEFFPADTLTLLHYYFPDSIIFNGIRLTDSMIEQYKLSEELDFPIITNESGFYIQTGFNPFFLE